MRIRKHAKLASSAPFSAPVDLSTWEKNDSSSPHEETGFRSQSRREHNQGSCGSVDKKQQGEESNREFFDLKGSSVDGTTKQEERGSECKRAKSVEVKEAEENYEKRVIYCTRRSTKGLKCRKEAKRGHSLCDHHERRREPDRAAAILDDPSFVLLPPSSDFSYYAGFAPLVGRRRRRRGTDAALAPTPPAPSSSSSGEDAHTCSGYCDDAPGDGADREKKRGRKPMKSRSLKSLLSSSLRLNEDFS